MAYPTQSADLAVDDVDRLASQIKSYVTRRRNDMAAGNVGSTTIFDLAIRVKSAKDRLAQLAETPGIAERAQAKKGDESLNVAAEFNAMTSAMDSVLAWVSTNFPADENGYLLAQTLGASGPVDRQFTPQQTAGFRAVLDSLIATID